MRIVERLLRPIDRARRDFGLAQNLQHFRGHAFGAPAAHARADDLAVVAARDVIPEARIGEPFGLAHKLRPSAIERLADHLSDDPTVPGTEDVDRCGSLAAIAGRHPIGLDHRLFDQHRIGERHGGRQQRTLYHLPLAGLPARHQGHQRAEGTMEGGRKVDPRHPGAMRLLRRPGHVDGTRHDLADAVESDAVAVRAAAPECRNRRQDDVGLGRAQTIVIELHCGERLRRQVGDHDIGGLDQAAHDLLALGRHGIEGHAQLVAVHLQEQRTLAGLGDRRLKAILAALAFFDAYHLGAVLRHQRCAIRSGDISSEVEHPDAFKHTHHPRSLPVRQPSPHFALSEIVACAINQLK